VRKKHGPLRADTLTHSMNAAKQGFVLDFVRDYRDMAVQIGRAQWRVFFETGSTNKQAPAKHLNDVCGAAPVQMASYQVQEQIDGWVSNRANEFVDCVKGSTLSDATKKQLYTINRRQLWFGRDAIDGIDPAVRALARSIMRHCMGKHRHPDLSRISPRLDVRVVTIEKPETADVADLWAMLRLPNRGTVAIPYRCTAIRNSTVAAANSAPWSSFAPTRKTEFQSDWCKTWPSRLPNSARPISQKSSASGWTSAPPR
jgi:hypothetical protein